MANAVAAVLGWGVLLAGAGALALLVGRRAASRGILAPLVVGVGLRFVVMLIAHAGSLSLGDRGLFFLDDQTYLQDGTMLAELWRAGHTPDPARYDVVGTYQFGYQIFVGLIFTLGTSSILLGKLANVLLGGATVLIVACIAGRVLGEQAQVRAAWLAALAPNLIWWSAPLMKEALATMLLALGALAVTALPRPRAVATLGMVLAALMVVRGAAALALVVGAGIAIAIAGRQAERRWLSRPLIAFVAVLFSGLLAVAVLVSHGDLGAFYDQYRFTIDRMFNRYQGANVTHTPYDVIKSLVTPLPWAFDHGTRNWDRGLYPGVWLLLCAYPLAAVGAWRLRRRPEVGLLVGVAVTALVTDVLTLGFAFRQRSMIEPLVLVLALAGTPSWRIAGRYASTTLAAVAVIAGIQSRSPVVTLSIAVAAGAVLLATRRLSSRPFEALPESPIAASFRRSFASTLPLDFSPSRILVELGELIRALGASAAAGRVAAMRAVPLLQAPNEHVMATTPRQRSLQDGVRALRRFGPASEPLPMLPNKQPATTSTNGGRQRSLLDAGGRRARGPRARPARPGGHPGPFHAGPHWRLSLPALPALRPLAARAFVEIVRLLRRRAAPLGDVADKHDGPSTQSQQPPRPTLRTLRQFAPANETPPAQTKEPAATPATGLSVRTILQSLRQLAPASETPPAQTKEAPARSTTKEGP